LSQAEGLGEAVPFAGELAVQTHLMHLSQGFEQIEIEPVAHSGRAAGERVCSALRSSTKARVSFQLPVSAWIRAITAASSGLRPAAVKLRHYFDVLLKACACPSHYL
jgi:hypothetical protein